MNVRKVLFYHENFPAGGAERVTIDIANYISNRGYEVYVLAANINEGNYSQLTVLKLPDKVSVTEASGIQYVVDVIHSFDIDIFVLPVCSFIPLLEAVKRQTCCKLVFALHSVPFWEVLYSFYIKKARARGDFFKTLEWWMLTYPKTMWLKKYDSPIRVRHVKIYKLVDAYTVLCESYKKDLLEKIGMTKSGDKIYVIPNSEKEIPQVNLDKKKQLLFVGRMSYDDKRADRLIHIWHKIYRKMPDWELVLVGDGDERIRLETLVAKLHLERVVFAGYHADVRRFYNDSLVLCLTSNYEGWPLVLTEAQANGVIPVAFNCTAGVREILEPTGVNGVLIPPFSKKRYAKELLALLQNPQKCREIQKNVIMKARNYSPDKIGEKWYALFERLCD